MKRKLKKAVIVLIVACVVYAVTPLIILAINIAIGGVIVWYKLVHS